MPLKQKLYCHTLGCKMGFAVKGMMRLIRQEFEDKNIELTLEQYFVLNIIDNEEGLILQKLADIVDRDKSAVLRLIDGLEKNHFVVRSTDQEDKRRKILLVTKPGIKELKKARKLDKKINEKLVGNLSSQKIEEFEELLSSIYKETLPEE